MITADNTIGTAAADPVEEKKAAQQKERLKLACEDFEAVFIRQMLRSMRKTAFSSAGHDESLYRDMLDEEYARVCSKRGMGIARMLQMQLEGKMGWDSAENEGKNAKAYSDSADK